jgi:2-methylisocitrate lyase-like PEP mutase family enzyme
MTRKTTLFRQLIEAEEILVQPGIYDGFSARLAEQFGFASASISGAGLSESTLGWADVGLLSYEENVSRSRAIAACVDIPVSADADTGYGNAVNVYFTVRGFEAAGIDGIMLEDQVAPKRCGHMAGKEVISAEEGVEKIRAAVEARRDPDFIIKARTDATATHGVPEAIRRLNLYADAGADLLFADALLTRADIALVAKEVSKPLSVNMGFGIRARPTTPLISAHELQDLGVAVVSYPRLMTSAAIMGMRQALGVVRQSLEEGRVIERPDLAVSFAEINELMGLGTIRDLERRFLTPQQLTAKYGDTPAAAGHRS